MVHQPDSINPLSFLSPSSIQTRPLLLRYSIQVSVDCPGGCLYPESEMRSMRWCVVQKLLVFQLKPSLKFSLNSTWLQFHDSFPLVAAHLESRIHLSLDSLICAFLQWSRSGWSISLRIHWEVFYPTHLWLYLRKWLLKLSIWWLPKEAFLLLLAVLRCLPVESLLIQFRQCTVEESCLLYPNRNHWSHK